MKDIKVNYDKTFSSSYTRDYYRGRSFHYSGKWVEGMHYHNDDYCVDFVSFENTLLVCIKTHTSTIDNKPCDFIRDEGGSIVGIVSEYWDFVVSGFRFSDLTPEEIRELQQPAIDAIEEKLKVREHCFLNESEYQELIDSGTVDEDVLYFIFEDD